MMVKTERSSKEEREVGYPCQWPVFKALENSSSVGAIQILGGTSFQGCHRESALPGTRKWHCLIDGNWSVPILLEPAR